jgi:hypothetical protein
LPWSPSTGTGGRHPPETVVAFNRKTWSPWTGARRQEYCNRFIRISEQKNAVRRFAQ